MSQLSVARATVATINDNVAPFNPGVVTGVEIVILSIAEGGSSMSKVELPPPSINESLALSGASAAITRTLLVFAIPFGLSLYTSIVNVASSSVADSGNVVIFAPFKSYQRITLALAGRRP